MKRIFWIGLVITLFVGCSKAQVVRVIMPKPKSTLEQTIEALLPSGPTTIVYSGTPIQPVLSKGASDSDLLAQTYGPMVILTPALRKRFEDGLLDDYQSFNSLFFNDKLSKDVDLTCVDGLEEMTSEIGHSDSGAYVNQTGAAIAETSNNNGKFLIKFDSRLCGQTDYRMWVELHEMAHVATWGEDPAHGPKWLAEMRRLRFAGAYDGLY
jgi:hypothetical protein